MSDDAPLEPISPEPEPVAASEPATTPTAAAVPTEPVPVTANATGSEGVPPTWPAPAPAAPPPSGSSTIAVPKWLVLVLGALLFAVLGFGIGYAVAPGDDHNDRAALRPRSGFVPPFNNNGGGSGSDNLPTLPSPSPSPQTGRSAFLGVATTTSTDPEGARVARVVDGSPAAEAGLKVDDIITHVDGKTVSSPTELATAIGDQRAGDKVTVTYVRDGGGKTVDVTLKLRNSFQIPTPSTTRPQS